MRSQQEIDMDNQEYMDWLFHTFHPLMWHTAKKYCRKEGLLASNAHSETVPLPNVTSPERPLVAVFAKVGSTANVIPVTLFTKV